MGGTFVNQTQHQLLQPPQSAPQLARLAPLARVYTDHLSHTNVWGKRLSDSGFALLFLNVGPSPAQLTCNSTCLAGLEVDLTPGRRFRVRDVWNHADLPDVVTPFTVRSPSLGKEDIYNLRFTPEK